MEYLRILFHSTLIMPLIRKQIHEIRIIVAKIHVFDYYHSPHV